MESSGQGQLLVFGITRLSWMMAKGNVWYIRHYERVFEKVTVCYLIGKWHQEERQGKTRLLSVGKGSTIGDLILAPWRLYRLAKKMQPVAVVTGDIVFGGWTSLLLRKLLRLDLVVTPVCVLPRIYASTGRSLSGLPIWLEKILVGWTFRASRQVVMSRHTQVCIDWLQSDPDAAPRLRLVPCTVDEFPPQVFYDKLKEISVNKRKNPIPRLLYVGRLHHEKMVFDLIDVLVELATAGVAVTLMIAGDGPERGALEERAVSAGVAGKIEWLGFVSMDALPEVYAQADVFISTVTGTALREAGLAALPIVAYDLDWVSGLLEEGKTALLAPPQNTSAMARQVKRLLDDPKLASTLADSFHRTACARWSPEILNSALREAFQKV